jgi:hypothetical protein
MYKYKIYFYSTLSPNSKCYSNSNIWRILLIYFRFNVRPFLHISIYVTCSTAGMNHIQIRLSPYSYESMLFIVRHIQTALQHELYKKVSIEVRKWCIEQRTLILYRERNAHFPFFRPCKCVLGKMSLSLLLHVETMISVETDKAEND